MPKSATAFRTIREVADWLDVAAHVLRFWESKFNQIKPVKRAGGRRYYRPADMELVGGIKVLLHERGLTIRGVQKMIADEGVEAVTSLSPPIDALIGDDGGDVIDLDGSDAWDEDAALEAEDAPEPEAGDTSTQEDVPDLHAAPADQPEPEAETPTEPSALPLPETAPPRAEPLAAQSQPATTPSSQATPPAPLPSVAQIPATNPAEGPLGMLAALSRLPAPQRAALRPHIATLAQLRDRMAAPPTNIG